MMHQIPWGTTPARPSRRARAVAAAAIVISSVASGCALVPDTTAFAAPATTAAAAPDGTSSAAGTAIDALNRLPIKGRAPKTGYARSQFGEAWTDDNTALWGGNRLSSREDVLSRDLTDIVCKTTRSKPAATPPCAVQSGVLHDPYTGITVNFVRGEKTSPLVPIDHVVSLGDSWQKGAQQLSLADRINLANDPLNLIATTRAPNSAKSDGDAATWLPKLGRCTYVARQVAVKARYRLWVTQAERDAIKTILARCPGQPLPTNTDAATRIPQGAS